MSGPAGNVYDVIVVGMGPVGQTVAGRACAAGLSVAVVEFDQIFSKKCPGGPHPKPNAC